MILYGKLFKKYARRASNMLTELVTFLPWIMISITILFFLPAILHYLWNDTVPEIFGLKEISYWQAFRLFLIAFLLFGVWSVGG